VKTRSIIFGAALLTALAVAQASAVAAPGDISTVAGNGTAGFLGDGGPATSAELGTPRDVAPLPGGGFLIADSNNNVIRMVSPAGVITTVAGTGVNGYNGDGILATNAQLGGPRGIQPLPGGGFLIADFQNNRVRMVDPGGIIHTVAGDGTGTFGGDGGPATSAGVDLPRDVALTPDGGYLIGEHLADCVRKVSPTGIISTAAGICGSFGNSGNGGPATAATFNTVNGVSSFPDGSFVVTDGPADSVRIVGTDGIIRQAAGNGTSGFSGDGGPATSAAIDGPRQLAALPGGGFLFADHNNNRVRYVSPAGVIGTVAGNGTAAFSGDGSCARSASLSGPEGVSATTNGGLLIPDADNQRIRQLAGSAFTLGKLKQKTKKGVGILGVTFPGPGTYTIGGTGVKAVSGKASAPKLRIRAAGKKSKRLARKGSVKLDPVVTYTAACGPFPVSQDRKLKLVKRIKR
jgi:trimeric autotransporter adhesin